VPSKAEPAPTYAAFAVGFENWRVDCIKDLAVKVTDDSLAPPPPFLLLLL